MPHALGTDLSINETQRDGWTMRLLTITKWGVLTALMLGSFTVFAYDDDKDKERCRDPKVQEFTLPLYEGVNSKEAQPEAEFSFIVSGWGNPKKFKLSGKDLDIPFTVESNDSFHKVKAKLLPEFNGKFVRINARIPAVLECYTTIGWLVKVGGKPVAAAPASQETAAPKVESSNSTTTAPQTETPASTTAAPPPKDTAKPAEKPAVSPQ